MSFFSEIKSSLNEIYSEFSQHIIMNSIAYKCIITNGETSMDLEVGGFVRECDFNVKFLESELAGIRPKVGDIIEYNKNRYRIEWVSTYLNRGQCEVSVKAI